MATGNVTNETLALLKAAQADPNLDIQKAWNQSSSAVGGITAYDLEKPAKLLYPVITPLRNRIPRVSGKGGIQANWRAVTGVNVGNMSAGVSQGNRGGVMSTTTANYLAAYKGLGLEDYVTFEADLAAEEFQDLKALAVEGLLRAMMIREENVILGGRGTVGLGVTPTPTLAGLTTGGTLGASLVLSVIAVALTNDGFQSSNIANGIPGQITRANADGTTDTYGGGSAQKSTNATVTLSTGTTNSATAIVAPVQGAVAYAWFWGAAGSEVLGAITTINSVVITATATGTQTAASLTDSDNSVNDLVYDGLLTMTSNPANNAYYSAQPTGTAGTGTPLTSDGAGGIVEIDAALKWFWDNYRLSPTDIYMSSQEALNITKKVLASATGGAQRFTFEVKQEMLAGGTVVRSYLNKFGMNGAVELPLHLHPNMPAGTILFYCDLLPYPLSNVRNVLQIRARRDYYQIEWPMVTRKYEYGVYADEVLQNYFPPSFGMITNIANG